MITTKFKLKEKEGTSFIWSRKMLYLLNRKVYYRDKVILGWIESHKPISRPYI